MSAAIVPEAVTPLAVSGATVRIGELCAGYGGLGMAVQAVLGGEIAWVADNDPGAAAILAHRFPGVPNPGDITVTDWAAVEPVDVLCAGFPCQPISLAGKQLGEADERWLWPEVARSIRDLRPRLVFLENVAALVVRGLAGVTADLAAIGYVGSWVCVRASDAGAPHRRERVFIIAWPAEDAHRATGGEWWFAAPGQAACGWPRADAGRSGGMRSATDSHRETGAGLADAPQRGANGRALADRGRSQTGESGTPADSAGDGRDARRAEPAGIIGGSDAPERGHGLAADAGCRAWSGWPDEPVGGPDRGAAAADDRPAGGRRLAPADPRGARLGQHAGEPPAQKAGPLAGDEPSGDRGLRPAAEWGPYAGTIAQWGRILGRPAPRPTEPGRTGERLSPRFVEWLMGLPEGWVTDVPGLSRNAQLKALGNGVVPQQGALALSLLLDRVRPERAA